MDEESPPRKKARKQYVRASLSCTECARRKLRCSKSVPCSACVERGISHLCQRKDERVATLSKSPSTIAQSPSVTGTTGSENTASIFVPQQQPFDSSPTHTFLRKDHQATGASYAVPARLVDGVAEDFAVTLEFLALGRQRVLQLAEEKEISPIIAPDSSGIDHFLTEEQAIFITDYHQENLVWTHNVVHLPTFRRQVQCLFAKSPPQDRCWPALYYAMVSHSIYHMDPRLLADIGLHNPQQLAEKAHQMSIDALHRADFMSFHSLLSVQTICLLIYVGHNLGQSDLLSVLLASAIRIAQCLGIHRLGSTKSLPLTARSGHHEPAKPLIEREIQCRVWWFLIRQDWLQIPFINTYTIHPSQFNTPMPKNCLDGKDSTLQNGRLLEQENHTYTDCSYTSILNKVSVLVWKTQDRMYSLGHPSKSNDGVRKLYEEVLQADVELKRIMQELPLFYREEDKNIPSSLPSSLIYQRSVLQLSLAHKFFTLHRHFQVVSFKDPWYTYSRMTCLSIARQSLQSLFSLPPEDAHTWTIHNLWTVNTQIVTATIWLMFEQLFANSSSSFSSSMAPSVSTPIFPRKETLNLVHQAVTTLQKSQPRSQIAKRGVRLLEFLLDLEQSISQGQRKKIDVSDIISHVQRVSTNNNRDEINAQSTFMTEIEMPSAADWLAQGSVSWEGLFDSVEGWEDFVPF